MQRSASPFCRPIMPCGQMSNEINRNWATAEYGCRVVEASEGDVTSAGCLLNDAPDIPGWAPRKPYPHHIILHLQQHPPLNFLGWHAGDDDQRNPKTAYIYSGETLDNMERVIKCQAIRGRGVQMWRARKGIPTNHCFIKLVFAEPLFPEDEADAVNGVHGGMGGLLRLLLFEEEPSLKQTQRGRSLPCVEGPPRVQLEAHQRVLQHREDPPSPAAHGSDAAAPHAPQHFERGGSLTALAEEVLEEEQRRELLAPYQRMHDDDAPAENYPHPPPRPPRSATMSISPHPTQPRSSSPPPQDDDAYDSHSPGTDRPWEEVAREEMAGLGRQPGPIAGAYRGTPSPPDNRSGGGGSVRKRLNKDALHVVMEGLHRDVKRLHKIRNASPLRPPPQGSGSQPPSPQNEHSDTRSHSGQGPVVWDGISHPSAQRAGLREHHCARSHAGDSVGDPVWMAVFRSYDDRLARCENQVQRILAMLEVRQQREDQERTMREAREASQSVASASVTTSAPHALPSLDFPTDEMQELVLKWVRPAMQKWAKVLEKKIVQNLNAKIDQSFERITKATIDKKVDEVMQGMKMFSSNTDALENVMKKAAWEAKEGKGASRLDVSMGHGCSRPACPGADRSAPMATSPTLREIMLASDDDAPPAPRSGGRKPRRVCSELNPNALLGGRGDKREPMENITNSTASLAVPAKLDKLLRGVQDLSGVTDASAILDTRRPLSLDGSTGVDGASFVTRKSLLR